MDFKFPIENNDKWKMENEQWKMKSSTQTQNQSSKAHPKRASSMTALTVFEA